MKASSRPGLQSWHSWNSSPHESWLSEKIGQFNITCSLQTHTHMLKKSSKLKMAYWNYHSYIWALYILFSFIYLIFVLFGWGHISHCTGLLQTCHLVQDYLMLLLLPLWWFEWEYSPLPLPSPHPKRLIHLNALVTREWNSLGKINLRRYCLVGVGVTLVEELCPCGVGFEAQFPSLLPSLLPPLSFCCLPIKM